MNIGYILLAILVFGLLIFIHELGHFLTAKWAGIRVHEFALGMGPTLLRFGKGETTYALRLFPIGGFVAMEGENEDSSDDRAFCNKPLYKRIIVTAAGATMNIVLGFVLLVFLSSQLSLLGTTTVAKFADDAVSSQQLQVGDEILRVNGHRVRSDNDLVYEFMREKDGLMEMVVQRDGIDEPITLQVPFRMDPTEEDSEVDFIYMDFKVLGVEPTAGGVVKNAFNWTGSIVKQVWGSLVDLLTGRYGFNQLSGPVGVTEAIGQAASSSGGYKSVLLLVCFITINLGVFNLLPVPALDGGRLFFMLVELIRRKPINPKYEGYVHAAGFALLMLLMVSVTFSDIWKLVTK
ncbi:site-2 protease family protein [Ruminococcaceae bacterium OttesenSCG-928-L11]|nr:site-2 protease family protein [Ruminococcaceae bacterium OttesenSCG-928-L11]